MSAVVVGIDCGLSGGIAHFNMGIFEGVEKMPIVRGSGKRKIDWKRVHEILTNIAPDYIFIEEQYSPKDKVQQGMKTNLANFGGIVAVCNIVCYNVVIVPATKWKKGYGLVNSKNRSPLLKKVTKADSIAKANVMFGTNFKKSQDGLAEASLIGWWGFKQLQLTKPSL